MKTVITSLSTFNFAFFLLEMGQSSQMIRSRAQNLIKNI